MSIEIDLFEDFREHEVYEHDTDKMSNLQLLANVFGFELSRTNIERLSELLDTGNNRRYLSSLSQVSAEEVEKANITGLTKNKLEAFVELSKRYGSQKSIPLDVVTASASLGKRLIEDTKDLDHEELGVLFMNKGNRILKRQIVSKGSLSSAPAYPRDIIKDALLINASSVIVFHNHPSGNPEPSPADNVFTQGLIAAGALCNVSVLDHLVLGSDSYFSYTEHGLTDEYKTFLGNYSGGDLYKVAERGVNEASVSYDRIKSFGTGQLENIIGQAGLGLNPLEEKINEMKKSDSREKPSIDDKEIGKTKGR